MRSFILLPLLFIMTISCQSEDDTQPLIAIPESQSVMVSVPLSSNLMYENTAVVIDSVRSVKTSDGFTINLFNENTFTEGNPLIFASFFDDGTLLSVSAFEPERFENPLEFLNNYLDFDIISNDLQARLIEISIQGELFDQGDPLAQNRSLMGQIEFNYGVNAFSSSGRRGGVSMQVNEAPWISFDFDPYRSIEETQDAYIIRSTNGDNLLIEIYLRKDEIVNEEVIFSSSDQDVTRISGFVYNLETLSYDALETSGRITITQDLENSNKIEATFFGTITNGQDLIFQIEEGVLDLFK